MKQHATTKWRGAVLLPLVGLIALAGFAQQTPPRSTATNTGVITGRVLGEDGQPLAHATVSLTPVAASTPGNTQTALSDEEGKFQFTGLSARPYRLSASAPGYVSLSDGARSTYFHLGEQATLQLVKGGVITGRVTQANGEPVIAVMITAQCVRDAEGRPVSNSFGSMLRMTDDRGVYRLYGLAPGSYLVVANGSARSPLPGRPYENETPTYYPASTRDGAVEVKVQSSEEVSGIDLRYRSEHGWTISGKLNSLEANNARSGGSVALRYAAGGAMAQSVPVFFSGATGGYELSGVADGEYEVLASRYSEENSFTSTPRRVTVRGADVSGVDLTLAPAASLAGQVVLEAAANAPRCEKARPSTVGEIVLALLRTDKSASGMRALEAAPNEQGEFNLRRLEAGRYQLTLRLPNEHWYVRSTTIPAQRPPGAVPVRESFALKAGEKLAGVTATLAEGAASLRGRLSLLRGKLPPRVRVHLLPAEPTAADDIWRYAETSAEIDGSFSFTNLAPGKYWLTARAVPEEEAVDRPAALAAWERAERAKLRRAAETAKNEIELTHCQRVNDYALKLAALK